MITLVPIRLILIYEHYTYSEYRVGQTHYKVNNKEFKIDKSFANLSNYLSKLDIDYLDIFRITLNRGCKVCGEDIKYAFSRNTLRVYSSCSKQCKKELLKQKKANSLFMCSVCNNLILNKDKVLGTCGKEECINLHKKEKNKIIKDTHWTKSKDKDLIIEKRVKTRLDNDKKLNRKYTSWNKGFVGQYSEEYRKKISDGVLRNMSKEIYKKTKIEKIIETFLIEHNINYKYSFIFKSRQFDFLLIDYDLVIEVDGDYWHGNPKFFNEEKGNLTKNQILKRKDDLNKTKLLLDNNYKLLRFWECDIYNNFDNIKQEILKNIK